MEGQLLESQQMGKIKRVVLVVSDRLPLGSGDVGRHRLGGIRSSIDR